MKTCITETTRIFGLLAIIGGGLVWAGDQRWVTNDSMLFRDYRELTRQITLIEIKIKNNEATRSEESYLPFLKQEKDALEKRMK